MSCLPDFIFRLAFIRRTGAAPQLRGEAQTSARLPGLLIDRSFAKLLSAAVIFFDVWAQDGADAQNDR
jgi:hypothetical protein